MKDLHTNLTEIVLYKNTPFLDIQNTIHFNSNQERDLVFDGNEFEKIKTESKYNYNRDRGRVKVPYNIDDLRGVNYLHFYDSKGRRYYAYVMDIEYISLTVSALTILIDVVMTFTQGNVLQNLRNIEPIRNHLPKKEYEKRYRNLANNDDYTSVTYSEIYDQKKVVFDDYHVLILSAVNLKKKFGTYKAPVMSTSNGSTYDGLTSPIDLYLLKKDDFSDFMREMEDFPWIVQNFLKIYQIPSLFIDDTDLVKIETSNGYKNIYQFKKGKYSNKIEDTSLNFDSLDIKNSLKYRHMFNTHYFTIEVSDYRGGIMTLDPAKLRDEVSFTFYNNIGYNNEVHLVCDGYGSNSSNPKKGLVFDGDLALKDFDELPTLISAEKMYLASSAYSRQLANDKTFSGQIKNVFSKDSNLKDRIYNSMGLISGGLSISSISDKFKNEYETKRQQEIDLKNSKISSPSISSHSFTNAFLNKVNEYGVHLRFSKASKEDFANGENYFNKFGFQSMEKDNKIYVKSMTIADWVQFAGRWSIEDIDIELNTYLKELMEAGIRLYHYSPSMSCKQILEQDINKNDFRLI